MDGPDLPLGCRRSNTCAIAPAPLTVKQTETTDTHHPLRSLAISAREVACARPTLNRHAAPGSPVLWPEPHPDSKAGERTRVLNSRLHDPTENQRALAASACFMLTGWLRAAMGVRQSWTWRNPTGNKPGRKFARMEGRRHDESGFHASNSELDREGAHASAGVSGTAETSVDRPAASVLLFVLLGGARLG